MVENQATQSKRRYPFLRALLVLVLYGGFLALLWFFPVASVRPFFQSLLRGFGYFMAGMVLFLITLLALVLLPSLGESSTSAPAAITQSSTQNDDEGQGLSTGRSLMIQELLTAEKDKVWDVLHALEEAINPQCTISVDDRSGIVTVSEEDKREAAYVIQELRERLSQVGITIRDPH